MSHKTPKTRNDTAVQGTNDNSIVSKCSAAAQGYFCDEFLKHMVAKSCRRAPLINRGYYIRFKAMEHVFTAFLEKYKVVNQILCLGAGFDSSYFRLKNEGCLSNTKYFEVDFPQVVSRKLALIQNTCALSDLLAPEQPPKDEHKEIVLATEDYFLLGVDLTRLAQLTSVLEAAGFDPQKPTLIVSEVVLTYMTEESSSRVIEWAAEYAKNAIFVTYEQIIPDDAFGRFMLRHFDKLGSPLRTIHAYPTLDSQVQRYYSLGWGHVEALDVNYLAHHVLPPTELQRISDIEPFDEFEEWHLKCAHYMVLTGYRGSCAEFFDSLWPKGVADAFGIILDSSKIGSRTGLVSDASNDLENFKVHENGFQESTSSDNIVTKSEDTDRPYKSSSASNSQNILPEAAVSLWSCSNPSFYKVYGHTTNLMRSTNSESHYIVTLGGFGCQLSSSNHVRLKVARVIDANMKQSVEMTPASDSFPECLYHTMTVVGNGDRAVVYGGRLSPNKPLDSVLTVQFSAVDDSSVLSCRVEAVDVQGSDRPQARWRHSATRIHIDGRQCIFVFGGRTHQVAALGDGWVIDTETWTWNKISPIGHPPLPIHSHSANVWKGNVIIAGGLSEDEKPQGTLNMVQINPWTWTQMGLSGKLTPRYSHTSTVAMDTLFLVGGIGVGNGPPGVSVINLHTATVYEYYWGPPITSSILMVHNCQSVLLPSDHNHGDTQNTSDNLDLVIVGGGGNCFSFGTHFNDSVMTLHLGKITEIRK